MLAVSALASTVQLVPLQVNEPKSVAVSSVGSIDAPNGFTPSVLVATHVNPVPVDLSTMPLVPAAFEVSKSRPVRRKLVPVAVANWVAPVKVGAAEKTSDPLPVSSVIELMRVAESAVVVARDCASVKSARAAVCDESFKIPLTVVDDRVGAVPKTRDPEPTSSVRALDIYEESAVVVALDCASVKSARDAVWLESLRIPVIVVEDIEGAVRVFEVRVCAPPTVTTDAVLAPAFVTRRSPVPMVRMPEECVRTTLLLSKLIVVPVSRKRPENALVGCPKYAPPSASGMNPVFAWMVV
jgi:hypothetical protein